MMAKPRVLIVDDEKSVRDLLRDALEAKSYEVLEVANGAEVFQYIKTSLSRPYYPRYIDAICRWFLGTGKTAP